MHRRTGRTDQETRGLQTVLNGRGYGHAVVSLPLPYYATEQNFLCSVAALRRELSGLTAAEATLSIK